MYLFWGLSISDRAHDSYLSYLIKSLTTLHLIQINPSLARPAQSDCRATVARLLAAHVRPAVMQSLLLSLGARWAQEEHGAWR